MVAIGSNSGTLRPGSTNQVTQTGEAEGPGKSNLKRSNAFTKVYNTTSQRERIQDQALRDMRHLFNQAEKAEFKASTANIEPDEVIKDIKHLFPSLKDRVIAFFKKIKTIFSSTRLFRDSASETITPKNMAATGSTGATAKSASLTEAQKTRVTENLKMLRDSMMTHMKDERSDIKGVFRKSANESDIKGLDMTQPDMGIKEKERKENREIELTLNDKATLLKRQLKALASLDGQGLLSKQDVIEMSKPGADAAGIFKAKLAALPNAYQRDNIEAIMGFVATLPQNVPDFVGRSSMNNANLATCIAPNVITDELAIDLSMYSAVNAAIERIFDTWTPSTAAPAG